MIWFDTGMTYFEKIALLTLYFVILHGVRPSETV